MSDSIINTKTCTKCGKAFPATREYFYADKRTKDGFHNWCKVCVREYAREYKRVNPDKRRKYNQANKDKIAEHKREYNQANKETIVEKRREYYQANKDTMAEKQREYNQTNKDKVAKYHYEYYYTNKDELREYRRKKNYEYRQANPEKYRIMVSRRRARERSLPDTFTVGQWRDCLEYFSNACAVCGIEFGDSTPHADHWIPLNSDECTGTIAINMICLCQSCNSSKQDKLPDVWLVKRYEVDKANEILKRVQTYFAILP